MYVVMGGPLGPSTNCCCRDPSSPETALALVLIGFNKICFQHSIFKCACTKLNYSTISITRCPAVVGFVVLYVDKKVIHSYFPLQSARMSSTDRSVLARVSRHDFSVKFIDIAANMLTTKTIMIQPKIHFSISISLNDVTNAADFDVENFIV